MFIKLDYLLNVYLFQILSKISAAWQWTVCRRVGLFAADLKVESPLAAFSDNRSPPTAPNVAPHDIWIKFLARRFEVIKYYSHDQVILFNLRQLTTVLEQFDGNRSVRTQSIRTPFSVHSYSVDS